MASKTKTLFREIHHYHSIPDSVYWRGWVVAVFAIAVSALFFVGLFVGGLWLASVSCDQFGEQTSLEVEYRIPSGCYIFIDGEWIPGSAYRATDEVER